MKLRSFLPLLPALLLVVTGCRTNGTFTRLTPDDQPRNANNQYPVEVVFQSQQQTLRWDTLQPYVLVNGESLPLRPVPMVKNRWEGFVPVPPTATEMPYRFKFDYLYNSFGQPRPYSEFSKPYMLKILDQ